MRIIFVSQTYNMTRLQQFDAEVKELISGKIRMNMPEPKIVQASFCSDLPNGEWMQSWSDFKIAAGSIVVSKWITDNGFQVCKKSEATCLLIVGEKNDCDLWIPKQTKNYWLRPVQN